MNKSIFSSVSNAVPQVDTVNAAGGIAYSMSDKAALANLVCTGTFRNTFYATGESQLDKVLELTKGLPTDFIAKTAIYAREKAYMKDSPALLCAVLAVRDVPTLKKIFSKVLDNGRMLKNFVQVIRSGKVGRKSFGTSIKKLIQNWIVNRKDYQLFKDSVGNDPSLADVIKLVHPTPKNKSQELLFGYICGNVNITVDVANSRIQKVVRNYRKEEIELNKMDIPEIVAEYEIFKAKSIAGVATGKAPDVPFQMLSSFNMGTKEWTEMAKNGGWMFTRMNLNNFNKYGVFNDSKVTDIIVNRLSSKDEVTKAKAFPYQLLTSYQNTTAVPTQVRNSLQDAMEHAVDNIPDLSGKKVYVLVDTSGSMKSPVTGRQAGATSVTRCIDVAALVASAILRKCPNAVIVPFDTRVHACDLNGRDSIMTNATKLAQYGGGGTDIGQAMAHLNTIGAKGDLVLIISDNESFLDKRYARGTATQNEFQKFKKRNPNAKLINMDITPNTTVQTSESNDVMFIGGFSDAVFEIIDAFANDRLAKDFFVNEIEKISIGDNTSYITGSSLKKLLKDKRRVK